MARRPASSEMDVSVEILIRCLGEKSFGTFSNSEAYIVVEGGSERFWLI